MNCPCGSDRELEDCCGPLLAGAPAATAEALMRSRYTAYVRQDIDYLLATHDPETVKQVDRAATEKWAREAHWLGLTVLGVECGGPDDPEGVVEFAARWRSEGREYTHHERSRFRRHEGRWVYAEGHTPRVEPVRRSAPAVSPNAQCPCGSGRKYKRCHGAR